jgi:hypothetical protein
MIRESNQTMAKKKTAGPDNPTTTPATTRRRSARKVDTSGTEAAPSAVAPIDGASEALGTTSTSRTIDAANEMATGGGSSSVDASTPYMPSYEEIAEAAYQRYLSRGGNHGQDFEDWLEAERELRSRR